MVVEQAHKLGRKVAAHASTPEGVKNAVAAGVDSIEHGHRVEQQDLELMSRASEVRDEGRNSGERYPASLRSGIPARRVYLHAKKIPKNVQQKPEKKEPATRSLIIRGVLLGTTLQILWEVVNGVDGVVVARRHARAAVGALVGIHVELGNLGELRFFPGRWMQPMGQAPTQFSSLVQRSTMT